MKTNRMVEVPELGQCIDAEKVSYISLVYDGITGVVESTNIVMHDGFKFTIPGIDIRGRLVEEIWS